MYSMRFDMRTPEVGALPTERCEAAVDMCGWAELEPHRLHDARVYADWNSGDQTTTGIADVRDVDEAAMPALTT